MFRVTIVVSDLASTAVTALSSASSDGSLATTFTAEASNRGKTVSVSTVVSADCSGGCGAAIEISETNNTASDSIYHIFLALQLVVSFLLLCAYGLGILWGCSPLPQPSAISKPTDPAGQDLSEPVFSLCQFHAEVKQEFSNSSLHQAAMRCGCARIRTCSTHCIPIVVFALLFSIDSFNLLHRNSHSAVTLLCAALL